MATIAEIRRKYPQYSDMSDAALADALYRKFYSDMPPAEFAAKIGMSPMSPAQFDERFEAKPPAPVDSSRGIALDFNRGIDAGAQGVSPIVRDFAGNPNYRPIGEAMIGDDGSFYVNEGGRSRVTDRSREVVLTDPETGRRMVYARSPETEEGGVTSAARIMLPGMVSVAPTRLPGGVQPARPQMYAQAPGAMTGPAAGARLSAGDVLSAFERSGIQPSVPAVFRNRGVSGMANVLNETIVGGPVNRAFAAQTDQAAARAEALAASRSGVGQRSVAGERAQAGAEQFRDAIAPDRQGVLYERASSLIDPAARSALDSTRRAIEAVEGMIGNPEIRSLVTDKNFVRLAEAIRSASGPVGPRGASQGLSFNDLRQLRTLVRQLRPAEGSAVGISKVAVQRLYDGLTKDMYALAQTAGGDSAVRTIRQADKYTRALETVRLPALESILGAKSGEDAFQRILAMAQQGSGANWRNLLQIRRSVGPGAWDDIVATVIREMGNPRPGAMASVDLDQFSPSAFMTTFNKLSTQGKSALFGTRGNELRDALDDLATAVGELKRVERLGNPSGTGRYAAGVGTLFGLWTAPVPTAGALGSGYLLARAFSSPNVVRWLTAATRAQQSGSPRAASAVEGRLQRIAGQDRDLYDALRRLIASGAEAERQVRGVQGRGPQFQSGP